MLFLRNLVSSTYMCSSYLSIPYRSIVFHLSSVATQVASCERGDRREEARARGGGGRAPMANPSHPPTREGIAMETPLTSGETWLHFAPSRVGQNRANEMPVQLAPGVARERSSLSLPPVCSPTMKIPLPGKQHFCCTAVLEGLPPCMSACFPVQSFTFFVMPCHAMSSCQHTYSSSSDMTAHHGKRRPRGTAYSKHKRTRESSNQMKSWWLSSWC